MSSRRIACALLALSLTACQHGPLRARRVRACPGEIASTASLSGDFLLRQSVRVESGGETWSLQLVSQLRAGELLLIGFDPLGVELFTLRQRELAVEVDALPPPVLEIPPRNLLRDLHRIRFADALPSETGSESAAKSIRTRADGAERVTIAPAACDYRAEYTTLEFRELR